MRYLWFDKRILFYCHFPDMLLVQGRGNWVKRMWRVVFDGLEEWSMDGADRVVVNSEFTKEVVERVWKGLGGEKGVGVVYPCVDINREGEAAGGVEEGRALWDGKKVVLSINRFERKKDVGLAIKAFAGLGQKGREGVRLVVAGMVWSGRGRLLVADYIIGGYDNRVHENVSYHEELVYFAESVGLKVATSKNIVTALNIPKDIEVLFLLSVPAQLKSMLLKAARLLVYTPSDEHFGIVPLEAMLAGVPVLAANSGGPLETIVDGKTGWLRPANKLEQWTDVMHQALHTTTDDRLEQIGRAGRERVKSEFSQTQMASRLDMEFENMVKARRHPTTELHDVLLALGTSGVAVIFIAVIAYRLCVRAARYLSA